MFCTGAVGVDVGAGEVVGGGPSWGTDVGRGAEGASGLGVARMDKKKTIALTARKIKAARTKTLFFILFCYCE